MSNLSTEQLEAISTLIYARIDEFGSESVHLTKPALGVVRIAVDVIKTFETESAPTQAQLYQWIDQRLVEIFDGERPRQERKLSDVPEVGILGGSYEPIQSKATQAQGGAIHMNGNGNAKHDADGLDDVWPDMPNLPDCVDHFEEEHGPAAGEAPATASQQERAPEVSITLAPEHTVAAPRQPIPLPRTLAAPSGHPDAVQADSSTVDDDDERAALRMDSTEKAAALRSLLGELQMMSNDGMTMPTMEEWDSKRPKGMPKAQAIVKRHELTWTDLARYAKLRLKRA